MNMLGRRRHPRFLLAQPVDGSVRVRHEVLVEEMGDDEVLVLSPEACRPDDVVVLEIPGQLRHRMTAKVAECRPAVTDGGVIRHRLRLVLEGPVGVTDRTEGVEA